MTTKKGTCAYCAAEDVVLTIEHVFPESWYPDEHPPSAMLTVPACSPCNANYDRTEKKLFLPLVISLPTDPRTSSILERATRSAEEAAGKSERDREHRKKRAESFFRRAKVVGPEVEVETPWTPMGRPLGEFVTDNGLVVQGTPTVHYGWENLEAIAIKFLRGCYFARFGTPLRSDGRIWARAFTEDPRELVGRWQRIPTCTTTGDFPFSYCLAVDADQARAGAFFVLWDSLVLFASNLPVPSEQPAANVP